MLHNAINNILYGTYIALYWITINLTSRELHHMENVRIDELNDKNLHEFEEKECNAIILFINRADLKPGRMLNELQAALEELDTDIEGWFCVADENTAVCTHFEVFGVPTFLAVGERAIRGVRYGIQTVNKLISFVEQSFPRQDLTGL